MWARCWRRLIRSCVGSRFVQPLAPGLTLPSPRAAPWGVTLFGPTLSRQPHWGCRGTGDMKRGRQYGVAVSLLLTCSVLVACSDEPIRPAPVFLNGGPGMAAPRSAAAKPTAPDTRFVVVGPGQSLGGIAEANRVSKQAIIAANRLSPPYKLKIGQALRIPLAGIGSTTTPSKTVAASTARRRHPTVVADTRSSGKSRRSASEELIPLDDPTPPNIGGSAATQAHSPASDQTTWVSPTAAASSSSGATAPDTAKR
jgi:hypothetical protein